MPLVILIGASGSGKTTVARAIAERSGGEVDVFHFDGVGVPAVEEMMAECGSPDGWQRAKTIEWMAWLALAARTPRKILFEGQTRLSFLTEGALSAGGVAHRPILMDCNDETRSRRLVVDRGQPELDDQGMMNWARYLRDEAKAQGCEVLDTSSLSLDESVLHVMARLGVRRVAAS